jgi:hypothetical protein
MPLEENPNSRVCDLVDMVLLVGSNQLDPVKTKEAIQGLTDPNGSKHTATGHGGSKIK